MSLAGMALRYWVKRSWKTFDPEDILGVVLPLRGAAWEIGRLQEVVRMGM